GGLIELECDLWGGEEALAADGPLDLGDDDRGPGPDLLVRGPHSRLQHLERRLPGPLELAGGFLPLDIARVSQVANLGLKRVSRRGRRGNGDEGDRPGEANEYSAHAALPVGRDCGAI